MSELFYHVTDDAMSGDRIFKGNTVLVEGYEKINPNDIMLIYSDDTGPTLRRVGCKESEYILIPSNSNLEAKTCLRKNILVVGKVIKSMQYVV